MAATGIARDAFTQSVQYIRRRIQVTDLNLANGYRIGTLPNRAYLSQISWYKATAFTSASTDTIQMGSNATGTDVLVATDVHSTGFVNHTAAAGLGLSVTGTGAADVFVKWTAGGAAGTAGDVTVILKFITDHDG